jgi:hypothetical protein
MIAEISAIVLMLIVGFEQLVDFPELIAQNFRQGICDYLIRPTRLRQREFSSVTLTILRRLDLTGSSQQIKPRLDNARVGFPQLDRKVAEENDLEPTNCPVFEIPSFLHLFRIAFATFRSAIRQADAFGLQAIGLS